MINVTPSVLICLMLFGLGAPSAQAQSAPTCAEQATALAAGSRDVSLWAGIGHCPSEIGSAMGAALDSAGTESDTVFLSSLTGVAARVRDPLIASAAMGLVSNAAATLEARIAGELVVISQLTEGFGPTLSTSWGHILASSPGQQCYLGTMPGRWSWSNNVPTNYEASLLNHLRGVAEDTNNPAALRQLARCAYSVLGIHQALPASEISVHAVCGRKFEILNASTWPATLSYELHGSDFSGTLRLGPEQSRILWSPYEGTLSVWSGAELAGSVVTSPAPCP